MIQKIKATWFPTKEFVATTNLFHCMQELGIQTYAEFHRWSTENYADFWQLALKKLNIKFDQTYSNIIDLSNGVEQPNWLPDAKLNIANSCFTADKNALAIIYQDKTGWEKITYEQLDKLSNRIANALTKKFKPQDAIGICMPMTPECIAIYLGIIKAGCQIVSIADSFAPEEITLRLKIANAKAIFTQDHISRGVKLLPLYQKIIDAHSPFTIVIPVKDEPGIALRNQDITWDEFLSKSDENFTAESCNPMDSINILFSSGTTGEPKAIPWNHTTAIKAASDAYFHHNIQPGDRLAWPTNIGWMMGPWLIFASLMNRATIALYGDSPLGIGFGQFIQDAKVTMLGVVPTLVKTWRNSACMEHLDWNAIKIFSSTGECSNAEDMFYLMQLAGNKPVIEYCGGTEIGGGYLTSTVIQPNVPAAFSTPALGLNFVLLNEQGEITDNGEVALIPPSMGLSTTLLNKDHYETYFAEMPKLNEKIVLRRHGDQIENFNYENQTYYRALGRIDDTMNLGGVKVSSAEIERVLNQVDGLIETAAIAINPPQGGPSLLVIYAVPKKQDLMNISELQVTLQNLIKTQLNPLFKIHEVLFIDALPRTASNKIMRRELRAKYEAS